MTEPVTLEDLADHAALDKFHLCRAFREQIGMPPHAYLTRLRILRAKRLLGVETDAEVIRLSVERVVDMEEFWQFMNKTRKSIAAGSIEEP